MFNPGKFLFCRDDTVCVKYSYGPLCDHVLVREVGVFCSFAPNCDVAVNHPMNYVSTHNFMFCNNPKADGYFPGIISKGKVPSQRRIIIGRDVWIGKTQ